ncbi:MAG TPA: class I adenylate-forming enzyme family protein [Ramlibacter sp.]|nr:class I adenylate-forming enzyme family protein [Ramlibacter sp.]
MNFALFNELHARSDPQALALADERCRFDRRALEQWACRFANWLVGQGCKPGDRLSIFLPNRAEVVIALLGAFKAGVVPVPLNWRLGGDELRRVFLHSDARAVVTDQDHAALFAQAGNAAVLEVRPQAMEGSFWHELGAQPDRFQSFQAQADDIANLLYTSGSTSAPKAAIHTHGMRVAIASAMADCFQLSRQDVALGLSPIFHTSGLSVLSNALMVGCPLVTMEKWDLEQFARTVERERVSFLHMIGTLVVDVAQAPAAIFGDVRNNGGLRFTWGGGHSVATETFMEYERRMGGVFLQGYSRTEGGLTYNPLGPERSFIHNGLANRNSSEVAIFDCETRLRSAAGDSGEICVRGDGVSPGYWDGQYIRAPRLLDGGWQPTGDAGVIAADGNLYFQGRLDLMIKTGGENVYPEEVSSALLKIAGVKDVAVCGIPDERLGTRLAALVVAEAGSGLDSESLVAAGRAHLGGFKIPRVIRFVDALPRLGNGKVDLVACRKVALGPERA